MRKKLLIMTTHPIQYQAPLFRALAESPALDIRVLFARIPDPQEQAAGFGGAFEWDLPLRDGYESEVLDQYDFGRWLPDYWRRPASGLSRAIGHFKPDALFILGWQEVSLLQGWLAGALRGVPVLVRGESVVRPQTQRIKQYLLAAGLRRAHACLCIGQRNRAFYLAHGLAAARLYDAPYFVDNQRFAQAASAALPQRAELRARWAIGADALCLLFAGKLEAKKRPLDFLAAVARARDAGARVHALIAGGGALRSECEALIQREQLPATFTGFLNQREIPSAYVACDALVLPSDAGETWGLVVNEAMACGRPALVSDAVGCAPDLVRPGVTGEQFALGDVAQLAAMIQRWALAPGLLATMGKNAQALVTRDYSIACSVAAIERVMAKLPTHKGASP